jgi:hypothetical protein
MYVPRFLSIIFEQLSGIGSRFTHYNASQRGAHSTGTALDFFQVYRGTTQEFGEFFPG